MQTRTCPAQTHAHTREFLCAMKRMFLLVQPPFSPASAQKQQPGERVWRQAASIQVFVCVCVYMYVYVCACV